MQSTILQLFGPTASGKTSLAIQLANTFNGVIINADSRQVYRGLPKLTAMPTAEERAAAEHRMYEFIDPDHAFSVGDYLNAVKQRIADVTEQGKLPILVGGTGMYLQAVEHGISPMPFVPRDLTLSYFDRAQAEGIDTLYAELQACDEATAKQLEPADTQRICRALAVNEASGAPLSYWQQQPRQGAVAGKVFKIGIQPEREELLQRQEERWEQVLADDVVGEVRTFNRNWSNPDRNIFTAHGYRELTAHIKGEKTIEQATEEVLIQLRQYAKRQVTWLRNSFKADLVVTPQTTAQALDWLKQQKAA